MKSCPWEPSADQTLRPLQLCVCASSSIYEPHPAKKCTADTEPFFCWSVDEQSCSPSWFAAMRDPRDSVAKNIPTPYSTGSIHNTENHRRWSPPTASRAAPSEGGCNPAVVKQMHKSSICMTLRPLPQFYFLMGLK